MEAQKSQPKSFFKCSLPQCAGLRFNIVHKFPRNIERAKLWLQALDSPRFNAIPHSRLVHLNVCCRHFRVEDYVHSTARTLNYVAVPSLNLKKLNELNKCRQTEMEKATVLTAEETEWLKKQDIQEKPQIVSNVAVKSLVETYSAPEVVATTAKASPVASMSKTFSTQKGTITPKVKLKPIENIVSSTVNEEISQYDQYIDEDPKEDFELVAKDGFLNIKDSKWNTSIRLDIIWLRSICRCSICYDDIECIPNNLFFNLSTRLQAIMATVTEESRKLEIIWSDGHTSTYSLNELYENCILKTLSTTSNNSLLWTSQSHAYRDDLQPLKFYDILANQSAIYTALDRLQKSGLLIIHDIPKCDKDSVVKKSIISKIFNHLWDNLITEKRSRFSQHQSTPFTNCTFESMDKGLQILTMPYYKENLKMELCLVDGFQSVTQLSKNTYDFLAETVMDFGFTSKQGYKYIVKHPVITKGESIERIMYSPYHVENLKSQDFKLISMNLKQLNDVMNSERNQWNVELTTDTMIILDNYRICWCLKEPHKDAELDCFYLERKHYLSSLNILKDSS